ERVGVDTSNQTPITLNEAIALALANNKDINASRIDVEESRYGLKAAQGVYDPKLFSEFDYDKIATPSASLIGGGANGKITQTDATGIVKFSGNSPFFGGNYQINFSAGRSTTDSQFTILNPYYPSAFSLTYTQPLWRGLRIDDNRRQIQI